jgi:hypothetical protein
MIYKKTKSSKKKKDDSDEEDNDDYQSFLPSKTPPLNLDNEIKMLNKLKELC